MLFFYNQNTICSTKNSNWNLNGYSFGFNGKELDKEGMGGGASTYDYGFRIYNSALGRFLSIDPLYKSFAWLTPYQFASNRPIIAIDIDGLESSDVNETNVGSSPQEAWLNTVEIRPEPDFWDKAWGFTKAFVKTAIVSAAVVFVIAATGGVAGVILGAVAGTYGAYSTAKSVVELSTGKHDWGRGEEMTSLEKYEEAGSLAGGLAGGGVAAKVSFKGRVKIQGEAVENLDSKSVISESTPAEQVREIKPNEIAEPNTPNIENSSTVVPGAPRKSPKFIEPTNPPQLPPDPSSVPPNLQVRIMPPCASYKNGYWLYENVVTGQAVKPGTKSQTGRRHETHVPLPQGYTGPYTNKK